MSRSYENKDWWRGLSKAKKLSERKMRAENHQGLAKIKQEQKVDPEADDSNTAWRAKGPKLW